MHIATCFESKESSSGYVLNHIVDTSSTVHILVSQKKFISKDTGKLIIALLSQCSIYIVWTG